MRVAGMDPSMSNWGIAVGELNLTTLDFSLESLRLVTTEAGKDKRVRKSSDDVERSKQLNEGIRKELKNVDMVFVEAPHGAQSARAALGNGMVYGILGSLDTPIIMLSERDLKMEILGVSSATKQETIDWAVSMYPNANWLRSRTRLTKANEHLADAVAAIYAGVRGDEFKNIMAAIRHMHKLAS